MNITKIAYEDIRNTIGKSQPEEGGALFTNDGETVALFVKVPAKKSSGTHYSPDNNFINDLIRKLSQDGYSFCGFVHSHPNGCPNLSRGIGRQPGEDTISDEEAIYQWLKNLPSTKSLFFPVVQSSYKRNKDFSMKAFRATRDSANNINIMEESINIINPMSNLYDKENINNFLPCEAYKDKTVVLVGEEYVYTGASLAQKGFSNFIILGVNKVDMVDVKQCGVNFAKLGTYKTDEIAKSIKQINPFANIKIIHKYIDAECYLQLPRCLYGCTKENSVILLGNAMPSGESKQWVDYSNKTGIGLIKCTYDYRRIEMITYSPNRGDKYSKNDFVVSRPINKSLLINQICNVKKDAVAAFFKSIDDKSFKPVNGFRGQYIPPKKNKWDSLYSKEDISKKTVVVIGCGGSRSYVENLARMGISRFVLIDGDNYSESNLQTQTSYISEIGFNKAEVISRAIFDINPNAEVIVKPRMLDETISDNTFALWVGNVIKDNPRDVLIAACTDNFKAQARCSRLALKYGCPFIQAGIAPGGRVLELAFFHPEVSKVCPRCFLVKRYEANLKSDNPPAPALSDGTSVFFTEELNAKKGYISLALLLYHTNSDDRYSKFLDDNMWTIKKGTGKAIMDRNLMFYTLDNHLEKSTGIPQYRTFDKWGRRLGNLYQVGVSYFISQKPKKGCPDCGGKGNLLQVKGKIKDTREGIYYGGNL